MKKNVLASFTMFLLLTIFTGALSFSQNRGIRIRIKNLAPDSEVGKQYLVLIAINKYENWTPLYRPVKDAEEIRYTLESRYYIDEILTLYDEKATKEGIIKLFKEMQGRLEVKDSVLIFYAGHGHLDSASKNGFWIPVDGGLDENVQERWIPNSIIRGLISQMNSKHILLISDSCFSGDLLEAWREKAPTITHEYFKKAYQRRSRQVLTSGASERVPDKSEFSTQLKLALEENDKPYLDPLSIYNKIRWGIKGTLPMFGYLNGTNHQEGGAFLFFLKEDWIKKEDRIKVWTEMRADRVGGIEHAYGSSFKFPHIISYKMLKNEKIIGSCQYLYEEKTNLKGISSLKLRNFQGLGYSADEWLVTYLFTIDLSLYAHLVMKGKEKISEMRLKKVLGFDGEKNQEFVFMDSWSPNFIHREYFIQYKVFDFLSSFVVTSHMVASGEFKRMEKFNMLINKEFPIVEMKYLGEENIPFQGKLVTTKVLSITRNNVEMLRFNILKEKNYCLPVKVVILYDEKFMFIESLQSFGTSEKGKIFVSNLSFMDAQTKSTMANSDAAALINDAVVNGILEGKKTNNRVTINEPDHIIPNTDEKVVQLLNIVFDPSLTKSEKFDKIRSDLMEPYHVDALVTGHYVDDAKNALISIQPIVYSKAGKVVLIKNLQFTKGEILCEDTLTRKKILCPYAFAQISQAVQELIEEL